MMMGNSCINAGIARITAQGTNDKRSDDEQFLC